MGKTFVLDAFKALGAHTISADEVVGELLEEEPVLERLRGVLGDDVFDSGGKLLRDRVADRIFDDEGLRIAVEDILHPLVFERIGRRLYEVKADITVVEAPVIFERGYESSFAKTVTVYTDEETALRRLEASGIGRDDATRRLRWQMPVEEKARRSDYSIDNSGPPEAARAKVEEIYRDLVKLTGK
jgi:dephospho-CoA kinase